MEGDGVGSAVGTVLAFQCGERDGRVEHDRDHKPDRRFAGERGDNSVEHGTGGLVEVGHSRYQRGPELLLQAASFASVWINWRSGSAPDREFTGSRWGTESGSGVSDRYQRSEPGHLRERVGDWRARLYSAVDVRRCQWF